MYDGIRNNYDDRNAHDMTRFAIKKRKEKEKKDVVNERIILRKRYKEKEVSFYSLTSIEILCTYSQERLYVSFTRTR